MKYLILYLDGQGFIKEHKSKSDEPLADQNDLTEDVLQQNEKEITSVEFALVSSPLWSIEYIGYYFNFHLV